MKKTLILMEKKLLFTKLRNKRPLYNIVSLKYGVKAKLKVLLSLSAICFPFRRILLS